MAHLKEWDKSKVSLPIYIFLKYRKPGKNQALKAILPILNLKIKAFLNLQKLKKIPVATLSPLPLKLELYYEKK